MMDCDNDAMPLSYQGDDHWWCAICGAEWLHCGGGFMQRIKPGRTEPAELKGIRIPWTTGDRGDSPDANA